MRMPTKAPIRTCFALLVGASLMTACSGGGLTGPQASQSGSSLRPNGRSESGYVVAEKDSVESLTRTTGGIIDMTLDGLTQTTTTTTTTIKKKLF